MTVTSIPGRPLDLFPHFTAYRDPDQVRVEVAKYHCDHVFKVCDRRGEPDAWMNALPLDGVTFTAIGYGVDAFVRPGLLGFYVVLYLCDGSGWFRYGLDSTQRQKGQAVVASTRKPLEMRLSDDCVVACLLINESTLGQHLHAALGDAAAAPLEFELEMNDRDEKVALWLEYFLLDLRTLNRPDSLLPVHRFMTLDAASLLVSRLLYVQPHTYAERIERMSHLPVASRRIRDVLEYVMAYPGEHHTLDELAGVACCSPEALNKAFNHAIGEPPMAYVRSCRLQGAHRDLVNSDPSMATVQQIAVRWGFRRLGDFARLHQATFGENPRETLGRHGPAVAGIDVASHVRRFSRA